MSLQAWLVFAGIWTVATLPFGPNAANCVFAAVSNGFSRSLYVVAGILAAAVCHMAVTSLGLSTLLLANATVFQVVKWLGVGYLAWMALTLLRAKAVAPDVANRMKAPPLALVRRGFLTSMTNPKAILSYLALFPQFLTPTQDLAPQVMVLVPSALVIIAVVYGSYCLLGQVIQRWLSTWRRRQRFNQSVGGFYLFAALGLAAYQPEQA